MPLTWQTSPTDAWVPFARDYANAIRKAVRDLADRLSPSIESWMKQNAVWVDRTANARQTLNTEVEQAALDMVIIHLNHGMEYGVWLELAHQSRFSILTPALQYWGPRIWDEIRRMLS